MSAVTAAGQHSIPAISSRIAPFPGCSFPATSHHHCRATVGVLVLEVRAVPSAKPGRLARLLAVFNHDFTLGPGCVAGLWRVALGPWLFGDGLHQQNGRSAAAPRVSRKLAEKKDVRSHGDDDDAIRDSGQRRLASGVWRGSISCSAAPSTGQPCRVLGFPSSRAVELGIRPSYCIEGITIPSFLVWSWIWQRREQRGAQNQRWRQVPV